MIDLDRRESQALDTGHCAGLANEPRQRVTGLAIPEAAEVHAGQDDLAMTLGDATLDLAEHRIGTTTARRPANERDHAERARERAAVLDLHEGASALEPGVGLDAAESRRRRQRRRSASSSLGQRNDRHVRCRAVEGSSEIRAAPGHVDAAMRSARRARRPGATSRSPRASRSTCSRPRRPRRPRPRHDRRAAGARARPVASA